jgi:hypothetical protein
MLSCYEVFSKNINPKKVVFTLEGSSWCHKIMPLTLVHRFVTRRDDAIGMS